MLRLDWATLRFETIEEGHRRSMKIIHLPTNTAVEGVGEHVSRKQLKATLLPKLAALLDRRGQDGTDPARKDATL